MTKSNRFVGIDVGAETIKVVELKREGSQFSWSRRAFAEHNKEPAKVLGAMLAQWDWANVQGVAVVGRLGRMLTVPRVPQKQALVTGLRHLAGKDAMTVVSIGAHGFSVLEARATGAEVLRENSRCSQGTGNFLRQLVERFNLSIEEASTLAATVPNAAPLSGRCPVILKTDMTHLANKGEDRARILAGLFDAVCENVQVLLKPRISPPKVVLAGGVVRAPRVRENFKKFLERHEMELLEVPADDALYLEALGGALIAAERPAWVPGLDRLFCASARG